MCLGDFLRYLYTNNHCMENKQEELKSLFSFGATFSLGSQRCGDIAHKTGMLQWRVIGSLKRLDQEGEKEDLPLCEKSWGDAWDDSALG